MGDSNGLNFIERGEFHKRFVRAIENKDHEFIHDMVVGKLEGIWKPNPKSPQERQNLQDMFKDMPTQIKDTHLKAITKLSDELNLSEIECKLLFDRTQNAADAKEIYKAGQDELLDIALQLLKGRSHPTDSEFARAVFDKSSELIRCSFFMDKLLSSIKSYIQLEAASLSTTSTPESLHGAADDAVRVCPRMIECLFHVCETTELKARELKFIQDLVKLASKHRLWDHDSTKAQRLYLLWFSITLQATYAIALSPTYVVYKRDPPYAVGKSYSALDREKVKSAAFGADSTDWPDDQARPQGAYGLMSAVHAIALRAYIDDSDSTGGGDVADEDVDNLLLEVVQARTFTYLRKCIYPVLLTFPFIEDSTVLSRKHYMLSFRTFLADLLALFRDFGTESLRVRDSLAEEAQEKLAEGRELENLEAKQRVAETACRIHTSDSLEDFVSLLATVCSVDLIFPGDFIVTARGVNGAVDTLIKRLFEPPLQPRRLIAAAHIFRSSIHSFYLRCSSQESGENLMCDYVGGVLVELPKQEPAGYFECIFRTFASVAGKPLKPLDVELLVGMASVVEAMPMCVLVMPTGAEGFKNSIKIMYDMALQTDGPTLLKGGLFKALASIVYHEHEPIAALMLWQLIERGTADTLLSGLKDQLVTRECAEGFYPSTEGWLYLLEALLEHAVPDRIPTAGAVAGAGAGGVSGVDGGHSAAPVIIAHLQFVIDEVLCERESGRVYQPDGAPAGKARRYRLLTKAVMILVAVLKHYGVNSLTADDVRQARSVMTRGTIGSAAQGRGGSVSVSSVRASSSAGSSAWGWPRTVSELCANSSEWAKDFCEGDRWKTAGFTVMAMLLGESAARLGTSKCLYTTINHLLKECSLKRIENLADELRQQVGESVVQVLDLLPSKHAHLFQAFPAVSDDVDPSYWAKKLATACMGLLYECSLREKVFLRFSRDTSLSYRRLDLHNRAASVRLNTRPLAETLCRTGHLKDVAGFLGLVQDSSETVPSVSYMASSILELVALQTPSSVFYNAATQTQKALDELKDGCTKAIFLDGSYDEPPLPDAPEMLPPEADNFPYYFFSQTLLETKAQPRTRAELTEEVENQRRSATFVPSAPSLRESILKLLISTLSKSNRSLSHVLLGLSDALRRVSEGKDPGAEGRAIETPDYMNPRSCLEAVLYLVDKPKELLETYPTVAKLCYELLYRLCSDPVSSRLVLTYLRKKGIEFLKHQLREWAHMGILIPALDGSDHDEVAVAYKHCSAFLLQMAALDLRDHERKQIRTDWLEALAELFFAPVTVGPIGDHSQLVDFLQNGLQIPDKNSPPRNPDLNSSLEAATVPYFPFATQESASGYQNVELDRLDELIAVRPLADADDARRVAVEFNIFNCGVAASAHLCRAWNQIVSVIFHGPTVEIAMEQWGVRKRRSATEEVRADALQNIFQCLVRPSLRCLQETDSVEMIVVENVAKSILAMVTSLVALTRDPNKEEDMVTFIPLDKSEFEDLVSTLISLLIEKRFVTSECYRGYLEGSLAALLEHALPLAHKFPHHSHLHGEGPRLGAAEVALPSTQDMRRCIRESCKHRLSEVVTMLAEDSCVGPLIWRLTALSALTGLLAALGTPWERDGDGAEGSGDFAAAEDELEALMQIQAHSLVLQILGEKRYARRLIDEALGGGSDWELIHGVLALCTQMAQEPAGVQLLLEVDFLTNIVAIPSLAGPTSASSGAGIGASAMADQVQQEEHILAVLRVMLAMLFVAGHPKDLNLQVVEGCLQFLRSNHLTVLHFLQLRSDTLSGLAVTEALLGVMIAGAKLSCDATAALSDGSMVSSKRAKMDSSRAHYPVPVFDHILGTFSDRFTEEICQLLQRIGRDPLGGSSRSWWRQIQPIDPNDYDDPDFEPVPMPDCEKLGLPRCSVRGRDWTVFDDRKLQLGLGILHHSASFLATRASWWSTVPGEELHHGAQEGLLSISFSAVADTFCVCADLIKGERSGDGKLAPHALAWVTGGQAVAGGAVVGGGMKQVVVVADDSGEREVGDREEDGGEEEKGDDYVTPALSEAVDYLAVVLHCKVTTGDQAELDEWETDLEACLRLGEGAPSHSFLREVAQWTREQQYSRSASGSYSGGRAR